MTNNIRFSDDETLWNSFLNRGTLYPSLEVSQVIGILNKKHENNMKLEITKEKVLEAASKCSTAKETLKTLFPEAFEPTKREKVNKIMYGSANNNSQDWRECWVRAINGGIIHSQVSKIPGRNDDERVDSVILALAEKFNWS